MTYSTLQSFLKRQKTAPFPGEGWNKWIGHDLSDWWLSDIPIEEQAIVVSPDVTLSAWWIKAGYPATQETIIVTHGYGSSRRDYNALLPSAMLAKEGFNVLLVDQRDTGESTCVDGRHSAGQDESDDFAVVAEWLVTEKGISPEKIGMFGVSGGAIATAIVPAKTQNISAFALEAPIFDFAETARAEVVFQGFPGWLWFLADAAARLRGVNLNETPIPAGIEATGERPILLLHGTEDQRLSYDGALKFENYARDLGVDVRLETFEGADHTEGMLSETERYAAALTGFFRQALSD
jgi:dipeptidyl aminopeptidase/acylaminoacyl peptidase